jgi:hypothetical protein
MKFRTGVLVGLVVGYYYGAKAGRARYEQIERWLEPIRESEVYQRSTAQLRDALGASVRETRARAKEAAFGPDGRTVLDFHSKTG